MTLPVPFPNNITQFVDPNSGHLAKPWYQFLRGIWLKTGAALGDAVTAQFGNNDVIVATVDGTERGLVAGPLDASGDIVVSSPVTGGPPVSLAPASSPWLYTATFQGTLMVFGAQVEFSRDGMSFMKISMVGGPIPMLKGDTVKLTWFGDPPPTVFFPGGA